VVGPGDGDEGAAGPTARDGACPTGWPDARPPQVTRTSANRSNANARYTCRFAQRMPTIPFLSCEFTKPYGDWLLPIALAKTSANRFHALCSQAPTASKETSIKAGIPGHRRKRRILVSPIRNMSRS
jgi:hypothetical protein